MKKATSLYLGIGLILIAITLIIFFVPRMEEEITTLQYTKLGIVLVSQVILILNLILMSKKKNMFLILSTTTLTSFWFITNLVLVLMIREMQALITWASVWFLVYIAIFLILTFMGGAISDDMIKEKTLQEENKKKNLYKK